MLAMMQFVDGSHFRIDANLKIEYGPLRSVSLCLIGNSFCLRSPARIFHCLCYFEVRTIVLAFVQIVMMSIHDLKIAFESYLTATTRFLHLPPPHHPQKTLHHRFLY